MSTFNLELNILNIYVILLLLIKCIGNLNKINTIILDTSYVNTIFITQVIIK